MVVVVSWAGVALVSVSVPPGSYETVFVNVRWHMPNHYVQGMSYTDCYYIFECSGCVYGEYKFREVMMVLVAVVVLVAETMTSGALIG